MSWTVRDPAIGKSDNTVVVPVDVPEFPDWINYEEILARLPDDARTKIVLLATKDQGYPAVQRLIGGAHLLLPGAMAGHLRSLAMARQIAAFTWAP